MALPPRRSAPGPPPAASAARAPALRHRRDVSLEGRGFHLRPLRGTARSAARLWMGLHSCDAGMTRGKTRRSSFKPHQVSKYRVCCNERILNEDSFHKKTLPLRKGTKNPPPHLLGHTPRTPQRLPFSTVTVWNTNRF